MTVEEIFSKLGTHMREGIMYHDDFAQVFNFLCLRGYAAQQEHQFIEESNSYKYLLRYYTKHYHKLLLIENVPQPKIIPETWFKYTTMAVDTGTKRNAIKECMTKWVEWERSTKQIYQELRHELSIINEYAAAQHIDTLIEDVNKELRHAERQLITLETIGYDIVQIADWQEDLYKKYNKKLRW